MTIVGASVRRFVGLWEGGGPVRRQSQHEGPLSVAVLGLLERAHRLFFDECAVRTAGPGARFLRAAMAVRNKYRRVPSIGNALSSAAMGAVGGRYAPKTGTTIDRTNATATSTVTHCKSVGEVGKTRKLSAMTQLMQSLDWKVRASDDTYLSSPGRKSHVGSYRAKRYRQHGLVSRV